MKSWSLENFVDSHGVNAAAAIWQRSRQTVEQALLAEREIKIVLIEGYYEVHEFKMLNKVSATRFYF